MHAQVAVLVALVAAAHAGLLEQGYGFEGSLGKGYEGYSSSSGNNLALAGKETYIDIISPPKYEYKYAVQDPKTGDQKEQAESRVDDLTKSEYSLAEKDRKIQVSRVIAGKIPVKIIGKY